jgi:hypothetical protein
VSQNVGGDRLQILGRRVDLSRSHQSDGDRGQTPPVAHRRGRETLLGLSQLLAGLGSGETREGRGELPFEVRDTGFGGDETNLNGLSLCAGSLYGVGSSLGLGSNPFGFGRLGNLGLGSNSLCLSGLCGLCVSSSLSSSNLRLIGSRSSLGPLVVCGLRHGIHLTIVVFIGD